MHPDFDRFLFRAVAPAVVGMDGATIERRSLGLVDIPDGRVYACDPLVPTDSSPLTHRLRPGQYEVVLFVVVGERHGVAEAETCNAAAALVCSTATPERWTSAAREGLPADACAYAVDSGTGAFLGTPALELLVEADDAVGQAIIKALEETASALVSIRSGVSVAAFKSGVGDGVYDTWLGLSADGEVALILTDFDVLRSEDYVAGVHAEWATRKSKSWWQFWK